MGGQDSSDYQIAGALLIEVIKAQVIKSTTGVTVEADLNTLNLPEITLTGKERETVLELAKTMKKHIKTLDEDKIFNDQINSYAPIASKESFAEIGKMVFADDHISWGRIIVLYYVVAKLAVKMLFNIVVDLVNWCLDFFKTTLLPWIQSMGGWEQFSSSSLCRISPSANAVLIFMAGVLIGGLIAWKMNKNS